MEISNILIDMSELEEFDTPKFFAFYNNHNLTGNICTCCNNELVHIGVKFEKIETLFGDAISYNSFYSCYNCGKPLVRKSTLKEVEEYKKEIIFYKLSFAVIFYLIICMFFNS